MIEYECKGPEPGVKMVSKDFQESTLSNAADFVHYSTIEKDKIRLYGINPMYSHEYIVGSNGTPLGGGKMVFAFRWVHTEGQMQGNNLYQQKIKRINNRNIMTISKPTELKAYVFRAQPGTKFWSHNGVLPTNDSSEVAFPYIIEGTDFILFVKDSDHRHEVKDGAFLPEEWWSSAHPYPGVPPNPSRQQAERRVEMKEDEKKEKEEKKN